MDGTLSGVGGWIGVAACGVTLRAEPTVWWGRAASCPTRWFIMAV